MADALSSGGSFRKEMRVQVPLPAPTMPKSQQSLQLLYPLILTLTVIALAAAFAKYPQRFQLPQFKLHEDDSKSTALPTNQIKIAKIPILLYHYVEIVTDKNDFLRSRLAITPSNFEGQLVSLRTSGYTAYFAKEIGIIMTSPKPIKPVVITFDDGYGDFYTDAFPIIKRQNVKVTVFISSGLMGKPNYMTPDQVKKILASGLIELGGHGFSHQNLTAIPLDSARKIINDDVANIKATYAITPVSFAYPYGAYNAEVEKIVADAGYKYAVTLDKGWVVQSKSLLTIPRIRPGLAGADPLGEFLTSLQ